jgi:hypothetical protein
VALVRLLGELDAGAGAEGRVMHPPKVTSLLWTMWGHFYFALTPLIFLLTFVSERNIVSPV